MTASNAGSSADDNNNGQVTTAVQLQVPTLPTIVTTTTSATTNTTTTIMKAPMIRDLSSSHTNMYSLDMNNEGGGKNRHNAFEMSFRDKGPVNNNFMGVPQNNYANMRNSNSFANRPSQEDEFSFFENNNSNNNNTAGAKNSGTNGSFSLLNPSKDPNNGADNYGDSKKLSTSTATVNETKLGQASGGGMGMGSRTDLNNVMRQPFGMPVIRTPGQGGGPGNRNQPPFPPQQQQSQFQQQQQPQRQQESPSPPPPPVYQPAGAVNPVNQRPFEMSKTVTSVVDSWEAELAKHVRRRPSGQFDSCKYCERSTCSRSSSS